jgi:putative transposase
MRSFGPRPKRLNIPGHAHELTFSCYRRYKFFSKDSTCQWLCDSINDARREHRFLVHAYVFMPDHVHLIIFPTEPEYSIEKILGSIKLPVARKAMKHIREHAPQWLERLARKRGDKTEYVFWTSGGGYDRNIDNPRTLEFMIDYLHANPIRKGLTKMASEWKWSSAQWYEGERDVPIVIDPPML